MLKKLLFNKISIQGVLVTILILLGLFGPWLTVSYDSYTKLNSVTKVAEPYYHYRVELTPLFGSIYKDEILIERNWFISVGITLAGLTIILSAVLFIFRYDKNWVHFSLFFLSLLGIVFFFLSVGEGVSIGVLTYIGWGLEVTGLGILMLFLVSIIELGITSITRFMD